MMDNSFDTIIIPDITLETMKDLLSKHMPVDTGTSLFGVRIVTDKFLPKNKMMLLSGSHLVQIIELKGEE